MNKKNIVRKQSHCLKLTGFLIPLEKGRLSMQENNQANKDFSKPLSAWDLMDLIGFQNALWVPMPPDNLLDEWWRTGMHGFQKHQ